MSTKTTFKRLALVTVAALGLGVLASTPSSAAPFATTTVAYDTATSTAIVGGQVTVEVTTDTSTDSTRATVVASGVGSVVSATSDATETSTVSGTPTSGTFYIDNNMPRYAKTDVVVTSAVVGSQVLTITPLTSTGTPGTAVTKTITWVSADSLSTSAAKSTSVINAYTADAGAAFTADAALSVAAGTTPAQVAAIKVTLLDSNGVATNGKTLSVTVSGPGLVGIDSDEETVTVTGVARAASAVIADNVAYVGVFNDGTPGVSTITISAGTTVVATETLTFSGTASKFEITAVSGVYSIAANGTQDSATTGIAVKATDSAGNVVDGKNIYLTSSDLTVATVSSAARATGANASDPDGYAYFILTGVKSGTSTITACDTAACTAATITASTSIKVAKTEAATITASFASASYSPGEKMTLNIVAKDADGNAIADANAGTYTMSANLGTTTTLPTTADFVGGTHAVEIYAPVSAGTFTVSIKLLAGDAWATALDDTTITASTVVSSDALDAAQEATDAANAATDAALQAADDAAAASAAVAKLSKSVNKALKALKKQITALTALVNKLL